MRKSKNKQTAKTKKQELLHFIFISTVAVADKLFFYF